MGDAADLVQRRRPKGRPRTRAEAGLLSLVGVVAGEAGDLLAHAGSTHFLEYFDYHSSAKTYA